MKIIYAFLTTMLILVLVYFSIYLGVCVSEAFPSAFSIVGGTTVLVLATTVTYHFMYGK